MTGQAQTVQGVVLCRVGAFRLAVMADDVVGVEASGSGARYAGSLFDAAARPPEDARLLRHAATGLAVDALEVHAERLPLYPVPAVLARLVGGALRGFVVTGDALWPVVSLPAAAAHLDEPGEGRAS